MIKSYYSGFQSVETSGAQYNGVNATFTAPVVNSGVAHCDNPGANVSSWTGLQGPGDGRLIQDGVEAGQDRSGNSEFAWFEFFGTQGHNSETKMNLSIHQGDQIESGVEWHASQNNAQFTIYDVTTGQVDSAVLNNDYDFYNGAQGQFITERNMVNGTSSPSCISMSRPGLKLACRSGPTIATRTSARAALRRSRCTKGEMHRGTYWPCRRRTNWTVIVTIPPRSIKSVVGILVIRMHHGTWPSRSFWTLGPRYRTFMACSLLVVAAVGCGRTCSGGPAPSPSGVQLHSGSWPQLHPAASTFQLCFVGVCSTGSVNSVIFVSTQGSSALSGRASLRAFNVAHKSLLDTSSMVRLAKRESRGCAGSTVTWGAFVQLADNGVLSSPGS